MRTLLVCITVCCVVLGFAWLVLPAITWLILTLARVAAVAFLVSGAMHTRGAMRTFCAGALAAYVAVALADVRGPSTNSLIGFALETAAVAFAGWIAVIARGFWTAADGQF
jgi:hypothetical protein